MAEVTSIKKSNPWPAVVIGAILVVAGTFLDIKMHTVAESGERVWGPSYHFLTDLDHQGVPLNPGITVATIGVFLILFKVIQGFYTTPLMQALDERSSNLESTFSEAETLRTDMAAMKADFERKLASTEAEAREKVNAQIKEAQALRQTLLSEATEKSDALIKQAQDEIAAEKSKALGEIRTHVTDLALAAAEKVVGQNMNSDMNKKIVADFIGSIEVPK
jgi:F-type H+-transporting ATPase subunit b